VSPWEYLLLAAVGFVASILNVIAGGGSFLTLPTLLFLGMPAVEANGTNRVGVLWQNVAAVWGFHRRGLLDWRWAIASGIPAGLGALAGAWLALRVNDRDFRRALALLMVAATIWTIVDPLKRIHRDGARLRSPWSPALAFGFLIVGVYAGFVQAGVGFLAVAVTTQAGLDLVKGSAVKVAMILVATLVSLCVFASGDHVHWAAGVAMAVGSVAGGLVGVRLTVAKGHAWIERAVTVTVVVFAVLLWVS
jgi:uncharacterized protein